MTTPGTARSVRFNLQNAEQKARAIGRRPVVSGAGAAWAKPSAMGGPAERGRGGDEGGAVHLQLTVDLLLAARGGEDGAFDLLFERLVPGLRPWARGRLPVFARELCDTQDIVQDTVLNALRRMDSFEVRHPAPPPPSPAFPLLHRHPPTKSAVSQPRPVDDSSSVHYADGALCSCLDKQFRASTRSRRTRPLPSRLKPDDRAAILCRVEHQSLVRTDGYRLGQAVRQRGTRGGAARIDAAGRGDES